MYRYVLTVYLPSIQYLSFRPFLRPKIALKTNFWSRYHIQDCLFYTVAWSFLSREGFLPAKRGLATKKVTLYGEFAFFWLARFFEASILFFLQNNSGDRHGSVDFRKILLKAL